MSSNKKEWYEYINHLKEIITLCKSLSNEWGDDFISIDYYIEKEIKIQKEVEYLKFEKYENFKEIILWRYYINIMNLIFESFELIYSKTFIKEKDIILSDLTTDTMRPAFVLFKDHTSKSLILMLRGTRTLSDIVTNLHVSSKSFEDGYCHQGMLESSKWFDKNLKDLIQKSLIKDYSLKIIGHSLGSGVASILTVLWKDIFKDFNIKCYAFGNPSVFSLNLSLKYSNLITTIINGEDIVPRLSVNSIENLRKKVTQFHKENYKELSNLRKFASFIFNNNERDIHNPYIEVVDLTKDLNITPLFPAGNIYHILKKDSEIFIIKSNQEFYKEIIFTNNCKEDHHISSYKDVLFNYQFNKK